MNTEQILNKLTDDELRHLHDIIGYNTALQNRELLGNILMKKQNPDPQYTPHMNDIWKLQEQLKELTEEITELYNRTTKLEEQQPTQKDYNYYQNSIHANHRKRIETLEAQLNDTLNTPLKHKT